MAKGRSVPEGVHKYGHKSVDDKGSKHPDSISPGLQGVDKLGGSSPDVEKGFDAGASTSVPKGVERGDGTETLKGTDVTHKQAQIKQPPRSGKKRYPSEVRQHDGRKAPRSVK